MRRFPYRPMAIEWQDKDNFRLRLPWLSIDLEVTEEDHPWVTQAIDDLDKNPLSQPAQRFLNDLSGYPISYLLPREKHLVPNTKEDFPQHLKLYLRRCPQDFGRHLDTHVDDQISWPEDWAWNIDEIDKACQIEEGKYDPLTAVTYLMGKRLEVEGYHRHYYDQLPKALDQLRQEDEQAFFKVMAAIIRQTHYVTSSFKECVTPALTTFPQAGDLIKDFMKEEEGHDRLMSASLRELGYQEVDVIKVFPSVILTMELFKLAASSCPLAFTSMVGYFEGEGYEASDPLADVLKKSSKPKSARGYERHYEINKESNHNHMIFSLAQHLGWQDKETLMFTSRLLELASHLRTLSEQCFYYLATGRKRLIT